MTSIYTEHARKRGTATPQSQPIPDTAQVQNAAGGYVWAVDAWERLRRFLILGTEGGTYYIGEQKLTRDGAKAVEACIVEDGARALAEIRAVSEGGLAPKQEPTLFALALVFAVGDTETKHAAVDAFPSIVRTGTHLFQFLEMAKAVRGWGRALRRAVARWYLGRDVDGLAYQLVKYQNRAGFSHRDALRLAHVKTTDEARNAVLRFAVGKADGDVSLPAIIRAVQQLAATKDTDLIRAHRIPREAVPTEMLADAATWAALLADMPMTALVRNLGVLSARDLLVNGNRDAVVAVVKQITDAEALRKSRLHPVQLLLAERTYRQGHGEKGKLSWVSVPQVVDALDTAFDRSFGNITPTNKSILVAIDGSGSMSAPVNGAPLLSCREAAVLMSLAVVRSEPWAQVVGFTAPTGVQRGGLAYSYGSWVPGAVTRAGGGEYGAWPVAITKRSTMRDAVTEFDKRIDPSGTDCAAPIRLALAEGWKIDAFVLYTDNETWAGTQHPAEALREYRQKTGINAKMVVVAMASNASSVADPNDAGMLNLVGFDASAPAAISAFLSSA